jgi:hypothetical protein
MLLGAIANDALLTRDAPPAPFCSSGSIFLKGGDKGLLDLPLLQNVGLAFTLSLIMVGIKSEFLGGKKHALRFFFCFSPETTSFNGHSLHQCAIDPQVQHKISRRRAANAESDGSGERIKVVTRTTQSLSLKVRTKIFLAIWRIYLI